MACPNGREFAPGGREAVIAELEELGLDGMPGAVIPGFGDWRDRLTDDQLLAIVAIMRRPVPLRPSPEEAIAQPFTSALRHAASIQAELDIETEVEAVIFQISNPQEAPGNGHA